MDRERMLAVADLIEAEDRFDLNVPAIKKEPYKYRDVAPGQLLFDCETVGCVAGWTCAMFMPNKTFFVSDSPLAGQQVGANDFADMEVEAAEVLGLTSDEATYLFYPSKLWGNEYGHKGHYTAKEAALLLRGLANGEISFPMTIREIWSLQPNGSRVLSEPELVDA